MIKSTLYRRSTLVVFLLCLVLSSCAPSSDQVATRLPGRWQRVGESGPTEPNVFLSHLEFRPDGRLIHLLWDQGPQQMWMIGSSQYAVLADNRLELTGDCWRGWERFTCTRTYAVALAGDILRISDEQDSHKMVTYQRFGDLSADLPPTLAPPFPSPTPSR